ncbi:hypothetical protein [Streptomyces sp. WAC01526]|uniref:hypothetical protein n=1 Tax=Streptomyces sp. WAC01526 TaxID=2588709 RepID=UPI0011DF445B|nr:hypothetical protein [Streptomyces sp. WAC01526]
MSTHEPPTVEAAWLSANYGSLREYQRDRQAHWVAVLGERVVDDGPDPEALVRRVTREFGPGQALFASVVAERLG